MKNVNGDQNGRVRIRPISAKAKAKRSKSLPTAVQCPDDDEHRSLSVISPRAAYIPPYPVDFHNRADRYTLRTYLDLNAFDGIARCLRAGVELDRHIRCALADKLDPPIKSKKTAYYSWKRGRGFPRSGGLDPLEVAMNRGDLVVIANHLRTAEVVDQRVLMWLADQFAPPSKYRSRFIVVGPRTRPPSEEQIAKYLHIGDIVARSHRQGGSLDAALREAELKTSVSRSTAYRAYSFFKDRTESKIPVFAVKWICPLDVP